MSVAQQSSKPWWKEFYVWLVIAGPLSAILACGITAVYILQSPEALVTKDDAEQALKANLALQQSQPAMQPALTGRNHSATGGAAHAKP